LNGFRCIKLIGSDPLAERLDAPVVPVTRDYTGEKPVGDEEFRVYRSLFAYDQTKLDSRIEATDDSNPQWRREKVSFKAAYGTERMLAILFLPKNTRPPYQTVVFFPGANARTGSEPSSDKLAAMDRVAFIVAGGRAVIYPIYWGTYERGTQQPTRPRMSTIAYRDSVVNQSKDLGRSIDYLETRNDIQRDKLAYVGFSWGAAMGIVLTPLEPRIKVNVFVIGGFYGQPVQREVDQINFAPRITVPTLMLNGTDDFTFPLESAQRPMFQFLGTPAEHKRHVLFDAGHSVPVELCSKEIRDWLDKYLGPVK
jgi:dienelactone hydrolase